MSEVQMPASNTPSGWYRDPYGAPGLRHWDGAHWSESSAPAPAPAPYGVPAPGVVVQTNVVAPSYAVPPQRKSAGLAFVLTFFFGPLGMFYSTVNGAVIMTVLTFVLVPLTLGLAWLVLWPVSIIWGIVACENHNRELVHTSAFPPPTPQVTTFHAAPPIAPVGLPQRNSADWTPPPVAETVPAASHIARCLNCEANVTAGARFCAHCGWAL